MPLIDVIPVNLIVGNEGTPGAPLLHVEAMVHLPTGLISGHAEITQALEPPYGELRIHDLQGQLRSLGWRHAVRVMTLTGTYDVRCKPPEMCLFNDRFSATLVLDEDEWAGRGSFSYGPNHVEDVPVRPAG